MFSRIRKRFTYANVAMTLALVFAMSGGAYAASKFVITSTKQIKPGVLAQLKGKAGPAGTTGAQGSAGSVGPQGPAGAVGPTGPAGAAGANGDKGAQGEAGKNGTKGAQGEPWTPNNTLPPKASETGAWSVAVVPAHFGESQLATATLSFAIPLAAPLVNVEGCGGAGKPACTVHVIKFNETDPAGCTGGTLEKPTAEAGNLCVFERERNGSNVGFVGAVNAATGAEGAGTTGAELIVVPENTKENENSVSLGGTWAVTAAGAA